MTTGRAVSVPPSKSRSRQEYAAVRRTTFSATTSTRPSSPSAAPSSAGGDCGTLSLCQDLYGANGCYQDGYQPAGHDYQRLPMRTQARQT
jgi:hypothetical protein